jgi:hypothetical protein
MPQFTITATSAKANVNGVVGQTVSNTDTKRYPTPAEFADQAAAQANADKYAKSLCHEDLDGVWDWVGHATAV